MIRVFVYFHLLLCHILGNRQLSHSLGKLPTIESYAVHFPRGCLSRRGGEGKKMELESVKRYLEKGGGDDDKNKSTMEEMPSKFFERFIMQGLRVDLIEPGRIICSMDVPPRLLVRGSPHIHIHNTLSLSLYHSLSLLFHTDPLLSFRF